MNVPNWMIELAQTAEEHAAIEKYRQVAPFSPIEPTPDQLAALQVVRRIQARAKERQDALHQQIVDSARCKNAAFQPQIAEPY